MVMEHDYYQILGVAPDADLATLKAAFRRRALECHPDRGGSHEQMLLLNEAWEILSNPALRRQYDEARNHPDNLDAQAVASAGAQQARQRAEQYPRRWPEYEKWLNRVASDFANAKHGSTRAANGWWLPTVENSVSGILFIIVGALLGLIFARPLHDFLMSFGNGNRPVPMKEIEYGLAALGAAWVGAILHRAIGEMLKENAKARDATQPKNEQPSSMSHLVFSCERCGQKLRVPRVTAELVITCPGCKHRFSYQQGH